MSSAPVTPPTPATTAKPTVTENWIALIKAHETLIIGLVLLFLIYFSIGKGISLWNAHEQRVDNISATVAGAKLDNQVQTNDSLAQKVPALQKTIAQLEAEVKATQVQRAQVPPQIAAIPSTGLQTDIEGKLGGPLLSTPVLTKVDTEITDYPLLQKELDEVNAAITAQQNVNQNYLAQITGLQSELTDEKNLCVAQTAQAVQEQKTKDNAHKSLWYKILFGAGLVIGGMAGHGI